MRKSKEQRNEAMPSSSQIRLADYKNRKSGRGNQDWRGTMIDSDLQSLSISALCPPRRRPVELTKQRDWLPIKSSHYRWLALPMN